MSDDLTGSEYSGGSGVSAGADEIDLTMAISEIRDRQFYLIGVVDCVETGQMTLEDGRLRDLYMALGEVQACLDGLMPRIETLLAKED